MRVAVCCSVCCSVLQCGAGCWQRPLKHVSRHCTHHRLRVVCTVWTHSGWVLAKTLHTCIHCVSTLCQRLSVCSVCSVFLCCSVSRDFATFNIHTFCHGCDIMGGVSDMTRMPFKDACSCVSRVFATHNIYIYKYTYTYHVWSVRYDARCLTLDT